MDEVSLEFSGIDQLNQGFLFYKLFSENICILVLVELLSLQKITVATESCPVKDPFAIWRYLWSKSLKRYV